MAEHPRRCPIAIKIDAFDQQVCRDDQIATSCLSNDRCVVADFVDYASRVMSRSRLFSKVANEFKFVHCRCLNKRTKCRRHEMFIDDECSSISTWTCVRL